MIVLTIIGRPAEKCNDRVNIREHPRRLRASDFGHTGRMGLRNEIKKTVDDVGDALNEAGHRANAGSERANREVAGDSMTTAKKAGSVLNEGKEKTLAEVDRAKREIRDKI